MSTVIERIETLARPILADLGLDLYDLEYTGGVVRITIDRPGGVTLEAIADVTRMVSRELDHSDPIDAHYTLEVSSPGLERVLRTPDHFLRAVGMTVNVKLLPGEETERRVQGVIVESDDHQVTVRVDDESRSIPYHRIDKARTMFEWGGQPKPSERSKSASAAGAKRVAAGRGKVARPSENDAEERS